MRRRVTLPRGVLVLGAAAAVMVGAVTGAAVHRSESQAELTEIAMQNCQNIEALKAEFRLQANESYAELNENAQLLGITVTPELRAAALADRNRTVRRFAPYDC